MSARPRHARDGDRRAASFPALHAASLVVALLAAFLPASRAPVAAPETLTVFAAASLSEAFTAIGASYQRAHPGTAVRFNFAGSQQLAAQLEHGASADVFAPADEQWMRFVAAEAGIAGAPRTFAHNHLVVIVPRSNPGRIRRLEDLARPGIKLVIGASSVPVGKYSRDVLQKLAAHPGFGGDFTRRALANVVSHEENVKAVVGKVQLGEADAGIVYSSDVTPRVSRRVRSLAIPTGANVTARYSVAVLSASKRPDAARAFIDLVLAPEGQAILVHHGFLPPDPDAP